MWSAIICTVLYDKKYFILHVIDTGWCNLVYKMVCQRARVLHRHMRCWCCFKPVLLCVQHMSLSYHDISDSISNHLYLPQRYFNHILPLYHHYSVFEIWNAWEERVGDRTCTVQKLMDRVNKLNRFFFRVYNHPPHTHAADLSAPLTHNTVVYYRMHCIYLAD